MLAQAWGLGQGSISLNPDLLSQAPWALTHSLAHPQKLTGEGSGGKQDLGTCPYSGPWDERRWLLHGLWLHSRASGHPSLDARHTSDLPSQFSGPHPEQLQVWRRNNGLGKAQALRDSLQSHKTPPVFSWQSWQLGLSGPSIERQCAWKPWMLCCVSRQLLSGFLGPLRVCQWDRPCQGLQKAQLYLFWERWPAGCTHTGK